jgi:hypothetical protein
LRKDVEPKEKVIKKNEKNKIYLLLKRGIE